ncbi:MAG: rhomboid family intramembrane serine protease, partial [Chrysiogenales bacterium]
YEKDEGQAPDNGALSGNGAFPPDSDDFDIETEVSPGPLSHFPSIRYSHPAALFFLICIAFTMLYSTSPARDYLWLSGEALFDRGEWWRLLTAIATHVNLPHLLSNALILFVFGWMLHAYFGMTIFPLAALGVGVITNLATISLYEPEIRLLGASGMAYGMVALWLVFYIRHDTDRRFPSRVFRALGFSAIMLVPTTFEPNVSYLSHAIGFLIGVVSGIPLAARFLPRVPYGRRPGDVVQKSS